MTLSLGQASREVWLWLPRVIVLALLAFAIFGPITNMLLWTVTEKWYFPHKLPLEYGFQLLAPRLRTTRRGH